MYFHRLKYYKNHTIVFISIAAILIVAKFKSGFDILLADRFYNGLGWLQIFIAATVGVWLFNKAITTRNYATFRAKLWITFCIIFFVQFFLGALISDKFLLTGKLHIPVPFIIVAGAIYRGEINFMVILYFSTIILTGGIWCSHLCYFGGIDLISAKSATRNKPLNISYRKIWVIKLAILFIILSGAVVASLLLNPYYVLIPTALVIITEIVFIAMSHYKSKMVHCTLFCPIGTITSILKNLNPLRVKIDSSKCTKCGRCITVCKYSAIDKKSIESAKVRLNCTHCGDCIEKCNHNALHYKIGNIEKEKSKTIFKIITIIFYMVFVAIAMV